MTAERQTVVSHCYACSAMIVDPKPDENKIDGRRYCKKCYKEKRSG